MLIIFTRAIIIYIFLLVAMRLMGKKQLGELQPFEFAISLIVADLACIPMGDTDIPITYGLVPIFTLFVLHLIVTKIVKHSIRLRGVINGNPVIVITPKGIDYRMLKRLDMTISDLEEALRGTGYFSPDDVEYAIVETNGNLSVLPKAKNAPLTKQDIQDINGDDVSESDAVLPITLISEGKLISRNLDDACLSKEEIESILEDNDLTLDEVLLMSIQGEKLLIQPANRESIVKNMEKYAK